jgi:Meckel syndrome type 1 protein
MPDPPDKGRPSSAPLSVEDADRLADSFTPFWEDAGAPDASGPVAALTPHAEAVTAPMPAVAAVRKPIGKQTLLGIAPPTIEKAGSGSSTPAAQLTSTATPDPADALTQPLPAAAPVAASEAELPVASALPHKKTLLGFVAPNAPATPPPSARASGAPGAIQQSTPEVPGYAIAYTPKDPPSTPAVVIAPEAQSSPVNDPPEARRQRSQTVPSRVRSAPNASVAPLAAPPALDDFNPYAPKKAKGKVIGLAVGGVLLAIVAVAFFVRTRSEDGREPAAQAAPRTDVVQPATAVAAAPTLAQERPAETAEASAMPATPAASEQPTASQPKPAALAARRANELPVAKTKAKAEPGTAATRPFTRAPAPVPAPEPSPPPAKPTSRGVIVRDAPF